MTAARVQQFIDQYQSDDAARLTCCATGILRLRWPSPSWKPI